MIRLRTLHETPHEGRVRLQRLGLHEPAFAAGGGHDRDCLIALIDAVSASQRLPTSLELGARNGLIPHYRVGDQIRFDPFELNLWVREHLDGIRAKEET